MFAYITDLHGNFGALREFVTDCKNRHPELRYLLVGGDLTRRPSWSEDWKQAKTSNVLEAIQLFGEFELKTFFILGNDDIEGLTPDTLNREKVVGLTGDVVEVEPEVGLLGFSFVPPTGFLTRYERDEKTITAMLEPLFERLQRFKFKIAMCHAPPYGTNLDLYEDWYQGGEKFLKHVGCRSTRKMIERYQPDIGLFGHVHESAGTIKIGQTLCVNPGASNEHTQGYAFAPNQNGVLTEFNRTVFTTR